MSRGIAARSAEMRGTMVVELTTASSKVSPVAAPFALVGTRPRLQFDGVFQSLLVAPVQRLSTACADVEMMPAVAAASAPTTNLLCFFNFSSASPSCQNSPHDVQGEI